MTGTLDQADARFGNYAYNDKGRAVLAERAGGHDRHEMSYDDAAHLRTVTNPLGLQTRYVYHAREIRKGEGPFKALP